MSNLGIHRIKKINIDNIYQLSSNTYVIHINIEQEGNKGQFEISLFSDNKKALELKI